MRLIIQRVSSASVAINSVEHASVGRGFLILAGIAEDDTMEDVKWLSSKVCSMRLFADNEGKMNLDIKHADGEILIISQFTLFASTKKGNRPSFINAARAEKAVPLYESFIKEVEQLLGKTVRVGKFGADMQVSLINDGPVTIIIDSKTRE